MTQTFSFIVEFRGGTYCSQVESKDLKSSLELWVEKIKEQKAQIKFLGDKTIEEIHSIINNGGYYDYEPVLIDGLKNIWHVHLPTTRGPVFINIIKTDIS